MTYSDEIKAAAVASYLEGATSVELARQVGCDPSTIGDWVRAAGHQMRPRTPARTHACAVDDCDRTVRARDWCHRHWQRWRATGDPLGAEAAGRRRRRDAVTHGTRRQYDLGCRCFPCALETSRYDQDRAAGKLRRVPAGPVVAQIEALLAAGWTATAIQREAGLGNSTLWYLRSGRTAAVNSRTAEAVAHLHDTLAAVPVVLDSAPLIDRLNAGHVQRMTPADRKAYYRARASGQITEGAADRLSCTYLRLPLELIYDLEVAA